MDTSPNRLLYGDNLKIMEQMKVGSVDLIYLDPPFNSQQSYNMVYSTLMGRPVHEQKIAFADTWSMTQEQVAMLDEMPQLVDRYGIESKYGELWKTWLYSLRDSDPKLLSYLLYMLRRLMHMRILLKDTGSLYLHCDPTASHYLKVLLDGLFGHNNFRSEIIWKRTTAHSASKRWNDVHDTILFYSKSEHYTWNRIVTAHSDEYVSRFKRVDPNGLRYTDDNLTGPGVRNGESGKPWRGFDPTAKGSHWKVSNKAVEAIIGVEGCKKLGTLEKLDLLHTNGLIYWPQKAGANSFPRFKRTIGDGTPIQDVITDISALNSQSDERLGYATQKPIALLKRIIEASSNQGQVVFDPFCGCGTSVYAAHETGRQWIGCDIAILAIDIVSKAMLSRYGLKQGEHFGVTGIP
ncbi:MAG: site-specific DNA-methyltransferase, partial [Acidobacteriota bacterium]|nr:site-specific DNA-methyltransferase [Acidobacteriota bacterium]